MSVALTYRAATAADVPNLVALIESAYRGESSRAGWTTEADILQGQRTDAEAIADIIADPDSTLLIAESTDDAGRVRAAGDEQMVACCHLKRYDDHGYFGMFAVRPTQQGGGVGKQVLAEAERIAAHGWGVPELHMTVISVREELIAWYERRGYRRTGQLTPFPYGDERFGRPQRDGLQFELLVKRLSGE